MMDYATAIDGLPGAAPPNAVGTGDINVLSKSDYLAGLGCRYGKVATNIYYGYGPTSPAPKPMPSTSGLHDSGPSLDTSVALHELGDCEGSHPFWDPGNHDPVFDYRAGNGASDLAAHGGSHRDTTAMTPPKHVHEPKKTSSRYSFLPDKPQVGSSRERPKSHTESIIEEQCTKRQSEEQNWHSQAHDRRMNVRRKLLRRMLECDEHWQLKTNRLHKLPTALPEAAKQLTDVGAKLIHTDPEEAVKQYLMAAMVPGVEGQGFLGNCALLALKWGKNAESVQLASAAIERGPNSLYPYLHRSRALRSQGQYADALKDLQLALSLDTGDSVAFHPDIQREMQLLQTEIQEREGGNCRIPPDYVQMLELTNHYTVEDVAQAYRRLAKIWHPDMVSLASSAHKEDAAKKFKALNDAYSTLSDAELRCDWYWAHAIFQPPHLRLRFVEPTKQPTLSQRHEKRLQHEWKEMEDRFKEERAEIVRKEQARREAVDLARSQKDMSRTAEEQQKVMWRKLEDDEVWQHRTNQPHKLPTSIPPSVVRQAVDQAQALWSVGDLDESRRAYLRALTMPGGACPELVDNCATLLLLQDRNEQCVSVCGECLQLDPKFLHAYLHRARAKRCLQQYDAAVEDLTAAIQLRTPHTSEVSRELFLLHSELKVREARPPPSSWFETLDCAADCTKDVLTRNYRRLAKQWHFHLYRKMG